MDEPTEQEFLGIFEIIQCPFTHDIDHSYLSELLLSPSPHRMRILTWLLSVIDSDIEKTIDSYHNNHANFTSSLQIDGKVQLLTGIAATLGLCLPADVDLIRGSASKSKHIAFWRNLLSITNNIVDHDPELLDKHRDDVTVAMETMLHLCDITSALTTSLKLLPPAIEKEIHISLKTIKTPKSVSLPPTQEILKKISILESELQLQQCNLAKELENYMYAGAERDEPSMLNKLTRSISLVLNDLHQLQTTYVQTHENTIQPYCDKSPVKFGKLGSTIRSVDRQLSSFLQLIENLKQMNISYNNICKSSKQCLP